MRSYPPQRIPQFYIDNSIGYCYYDCMPVCGVDHIGATTQPTTPGVTTQAASHATTAL